MRVPELRWSRRHNIASLRVSFGGRVWHSVEHGDLVLGYNAAGRLCRVMLLDPRRRLPAGATEREAIAVVLRSLRRSRHVREQDLRVLESALGRCPSVRSAHVAKPGEAATGA